MTDLTDTHPSPDDVLRRRGVLLLALAGLMAALLLAGLGMRALTEPGGTNSYALPADALLPGHL